MAGVNVKSEIKPLKKVLLHRPGRELLNLTPNTPSTASMQPNWVWMSTICGFRSPTTVSRHCR